ncbi:MAG: hypothetical protein ACAH80_16015 [Alphaproteobacteria bacterium]
MKKLALTLCFIMSLSASAMATDYTILPYPKNGFKASAGDWEAALDDLQEMGATGIVITNKWNELEAKKRQYKGLNVLAQNFKVNTEAGRKVFFSFQPINTTKREVPPDLEKVKWNDPAMIGRYQEFLDHLALDVTTQPAWVSLANEADVYFEMHPEELDGFLDYAKRAAGLTKQNFPEVKTGVTMTFEGLAGKRKEIVKKLLGASEVAIFTYYPLFDLKPQPVKDMGGHFDAMVAAAEGKELLLQEVGYPSGAVVGSSEETQAAFFKEAMNQIKWRPEIKFAGLFMLHDFDGKFCDELVKYYGFTGAPDDIKAKFRDFLCTLGVKTFEGKEKPAWAAVKQGMKEARE